MAGAIARAWAAVQPSEGAPQPLPSPPLLRVGLGAGPALSADQRASLLARLCADGGLLPSLAQTRAWWAEGALQASVGEAALGTAEAAAAEEAQEAEQEGEGEDGAQSPALEGRLGAGGAAALLRRCLAHAAPALAEASPALAARAAAALEDVLADNALEMGGRRVTFRDFHNNALGCLVDALHNVLRP